MPIYEYRCEECGELTELLQRFDDPPLESCPECGGAVKKLISAPAFQFKGSGWYVTDYARSSGDKEERRAGDAAAGNGEASGAKSGDSGDSTGTESGKTAGGKTADGKTAGGDKAAGGAGGGSGGKDSGKSGKSSAA